MGICHNKQYEREFVNMMNAQGIFCTRIAGSGSGKEAVCDCIFIKDGITHLVEVKATKEKKFYMRKAVKEQLETMMEVAKENNCTPIVAIKFKHNHWLLTPIDKFSLLKPIPLKMKSFSQP